MKILMINHYAAPPYCAGGTRHFAFAGEMSKRGHVVTIVAASFNHWEKRQIKDQKDYEVETIGPTRFLWIRTPSYRRNDWRRIWNMIIFFLRTLRLSIASKPDLIIGSSPHLLTPLAAWILAMRYHVPFVMEVRDLWPDSLVRLGKPPAFPFLWLLRKLERFLYGRSKLLISMVANIEDYFREQRIDPPPIVYVPNAVGAIDDSKLNVTLEMALNRFHAEGKFIFGYVGAHGPANDLDNLVEAAKCLRLEEKIQLVFVGDGPSKPDLQKKAEGLPQIAFYSVVSRLEIPPLLAKMDVLIFSVHPALESTSPNKLLDYMNSGKPILCAGKISGDPVRLAGCGLSVPPQAPERLAEAMREMASYLPEQLVRMGLRGRAYILQNYNIKRLTDRLLDALERIL